jgi:ATP phosphoribosyltransferase
MIGALRIALPKGRLFDDTLAYLAQSGVFPEPVDPGRRLVVPVPGARTTLGVDVELLLLKNADVPVYVEHGVAQLGVVGSDVLDEQGADVFRVWSLPFGSCRISVAGREGQSIEALRRRDMLRVATKYPRIAERHFEALGQRIEVVELSGSVELGAALGLADVIVDLVETGRTLRENGLVELETIGTTTAYLVAHRALRHAHARAVDRLAGALPLPTP